MGHAPQKGCSGMSKAAHFEIDRDEIRRERDSRLRRVYNINNPYGYSLNVSNPVLQKWYMSYMQRNGIRIPPPDKVRLEWEQEVMQRIKEKYKEVYHDTLEEPVIGWREQRVEEIVQMLGGTYGEKM